MDETEVRELLSKKGFLKIRKKYGPKHAPIISAPIISADRNGMRIWVELNTNEFQTSMFDGKQIRRTCGHHNELKDI